MIKAHRCIENLEETVHATDWFSAVDSLLGKWGAMETTCRTCPGMPTQAMFYLAFHKNSPPKNGGFFNEPAFASVQDTAGPVAAVQFSDSHCTDRLQITEIAFTTDIAEHTRHCTWRAGSLNASRKFSATEIDDQSIRR